MDHQDAANVQLMKTKMRSCSRGRWPRPWVADGMNSEPRPTTAATTARSRNVHVGTPLRSFAVFLHAELRLTTTRLLLKRVSIHLHLVRFLRVCRYVQQS